MHIATRLAHTDDRAAIWSLYQDAMRPHIESIWGWDDNWQAADFNKAFASAATYVVEAGSALAGYIQLDIEEGSVYLRMIVLAPAARSLGMGACLIAEILQRCRQAGPPLHLRVFRVNGAAQRFYRREGWRVEAED